MVKFNGVSMIPSQLWTCPDVVFTTDSSLTGCGGLTDDQYFHRRFPEFVLKQQLPIHVLEILAVTVAVRIWGRLYAGQRIQLYCDNSSSVLAINTGRTRDRFVGDCVRQLWLEVAKYDFQIKAVHLPGVQSCRLFISLAF